ncbi:hypothetical protein [Archangium sp.]|uniref:hypothetical protein n=1 Tax=Archangium sp. TaxID=1872627 RepID=UPI002D760DDF|nr:hypothetical protein [Archangium sp.]HYO51819.1 hypothetical protein [Archangium sp.]
MAHPAPPHVQSAQAQVAAALQQVEGKPVDLLTVPWSQVETSIPKLLGGAFQPNEPNHQGLALGLAGAFAERLAKEHNAFWFPNRDSPEGASLGFPEMPIVLSPFSEVMNSLVQGKLARLDEVAADIRRTLGEARFGAAGNKSKLGPAEYQRMVDPGFMQFLVVDPAKAQKTLETKPDVLARDIRDALGRATQLPSEVRQQFEGQVVAVLQQMDATKTLADQVEVAPRIAELMIHLFATQGNTGAAQNEFWGQLILPLLFIGAPQSFPPVDDEELEAFAQGATAMELFVDVVPHAVQAPEDGLLGAFDRSEVGLVHPSFERAGMQRFLKLNTARIKPLLERFDANQMVDAVRRFTKYMEEKAGKGAPPNPQNEEMLKAATVLLTDLKRAVTEVKGELCLRQITEADAMSEQVVGAVRQALNAPRIILA